MTLVVNFWLVSGFTYEYFKSLWIVEHEVLLRFQTLILISLLMEHGACTEVYS